mmetsp:Transcript_11324/g.30896  ORF Transcript_11324/g.30896 Transcript_11324/m.30896 type:complete len:354 (+) Transcript_11324:165-1226(+)
MVPAARRDRLHHAGCCSQGRAARRGTSLDALHGLAAGRLHRLAARSRHVPVIWDLVITEVLDELGQLLALACIQAVASDLRLVEVLERAYGLAVDVVHLDALLHGHRQVLRLAELLLVRTGNPELREALSHRLLVLRDLPPHLELVRLGRNVAADGGVGAHLLAPGARGLLVLRVDVTVRVLVVGVAAGRLAGGLLLAARRGGRRSGDDGSGSGRGHGLPALPHYLQGLSEALLDHGADIFHAFRHALFLLELAAQIFHAPVVVALEAVVGARLIVAVGLLLGPEWPHILVVARQDALWDAEDVVLLLRLRRRPLVQLRVLRLRCWRLAPEGHPEAAPGSAQVPLGALLRQTR